MISAREAIDNWSTYREGVLSTKQKIYAHDDFIRFINLGQEAAANSPEYKTLLAEVNFMTSDEMTALAVVGYSYATS